MPANSPEFEFSTPKGYNLYPIAEETDFNQPEV